jgi:hypothetical protein
MLHSETEASGNRNIMKSVAAARSNGRACRLRSRRAIAPFSDILARQP